MRDFRNDSRGGGFDRGNRGGSRFGGRSDGGFGGRGGFDRNRGSSRGPVQMHDATCSKCGKQCQVPFRPTGSKPVFCSECFRPEGNDRHSFSPRSSERSPSQGAASGAQLAEINAKLDRILVVLQDLEIDSGDEEDGEPVEEPVADAADDVEEDTE